MQLKRLRSKGTFLLALATLARGPVIPLVKQFASLSYCLFQKSWSFHSLVPTFVGISSIHALSGATTYVTSDSGNSFEGTSGESFNFAFMTGGNYKAFSYTVSGLPESLSFNGDVNGPMITGSLPSAGSYLINIIGHRYSGQNGNQTPPYNLSIKVAEANEETANEKTNSSSDNQESSTNNSQSVSPWNDTNTQSLSAGWSRSSWFGDFYGKEQGWVYHFNHGWIYLKGTDESGFWFYDETLGWLYTGKDVYPFVYRDSTSSWLYDQSSSSERKLWDYARSQVITLQKN